MAITASMVKELREETGAPMMACKKALTEVDGDKAKAVDLLRKQGEAKAEKRSGKTAAEGRISVSTNSEQNCGFMIEANAETDFVAKDAGFVAFAEQVAALGLESKAGDVNTLSNLPVNGGASVEQTRLELVNKMGENIRVRRVALLESDGIVGSYCHGDRIGVLVAVKTDNVQLAKDLAMHIAASQPQAIKPEDVSQELIDAERAIFIAQAKESGKPDDIAEKMVVGRVNKFLKEVSLYGQPFVKDPSMSVAELLKKHNAEITAFMRFEVGEGIEKQEAQSFADEVMAQVKGSN